MPDKLRRDLGLGDPDDFYAALIDSHRGLTADQSLRLNARLVLLLANHIGNAEILDEALREAQHTAVDGAPGPAG
ncbi:MAG: DUF2783 domain-containing protein [Inquilinus sp.]|nr:DUF2783 domain-containing protein [Inquilinus sp.]